METRVRDRLWARNLLFLGLICAGVAALVGGLFPRTIATNAYANVKTTTPAPDHLPVVASVDRAFREQGSSAKLTRAANSKRWHEQLQA